MKSAKFVKVPNDLLDYELKPAAIKVIITLYSEFFMTDHFNIRYAVLAEKCNISCSTVKLAVSELVDKGLLEKQERYDYISRKQISNHFTIKRITGKYFTIEKALITQMDSYEFMVLCAIKRRSNKSGMAFPSLRKIVSDTKLSKTTIIKYVKELSKKGFIHKSHYKSKYGDYGNNNYRIFSVMLRFILLWIVNEAYSRCMMKIKVLTLTIEYCIMFLIIPVQMYINDIIYIDDS